MLLHYCCFYVITSMVMVRRRKKCNGGTGCYVTMEVVWRTKNDPIMLLLLLLASMTMAQRKKPIRPMLLHSDGGNVKNKKRYYKHCNGIMEEKQIGPLSNGGKCFCCKRNGNVVVHNNALPLFFLP